MRRTFNIIYFIGIAYGIFIIFWYLFSNVRIPLSDFLTEYFLQISLTHVLLLSLYGWLFVKKPRILVISNKIETAGYLHTLIGFIVAIIRLQQEELQLEAIFIPIGSALGTSVIGWFLGGLLTEEYTSRSELSLRTEAERLATELSGFSAMIRRIHEDYIKTITEANTEFEQLHEKQEQMYLSADRTVENLKKNSEKLVTNLLNVLSPIESAVKNISDTLQNSSKDVKKYLGDDFSETLRNMNSQFENLKNNMTGVNASAQDVAKYLKESRILIEQLEKLFDLITKAKAEL